MHENIPIYRESTNPVFCAQWRYRYLHKGEKPDLARSRQIIDSERHREERTEDLKRYLRRLMISPLASLRINSQVALQYSQEAPQGAEEPPSRSIAE
jgi:hypothetical protein